MKFLVAAWFVFAMVVLGVIFAVVDRRMRSWPQPNWTTPDTKTSAVMAILPIFMFHLMIAIIMIGVLTTPNAQVGGWVMAPAWIAGGAGLSYYGFAVVRARKAPPDGPFLNTPWRMPSESRAKWTLYLGTQTPHHLQAAARRLGLPPRLVLGARLAVVAVALMALIATFWQHPP